MAEYLITRGADINKTDNDGRSPLIAAVEQGNLEMVKLLVSRGADINRIAQNGSTPLAHSVHKNQLEIVKFLISCGANINKVGAAGRTPLAWAVVNNDLHMLKFLLAHGAEFSTHSAFLEAIRRKHLRCVQLLGEQVEIQELSEFYPLILAVETENFKMVSYLVQKGANVNEEDDQKRTPLSIAASNCDLRIMDVLLNSGGADPNTVIAHLEKFVKSNTDVAVYVKKLKKKTEEKDVKHKTFGLTGSGHDGA